MIIKKFIEIEKQFPGYFLRYVLETNCGFVTGASGNNLDFVLNQFRSFNDETGIREMKFYPKLLLKFTPEDDISEDLIFETIRKMYVTRRPSLDQILLEVEVFS